MNKPTIAQQIALDIIKLLNNRKGFDYWWEEIDEECQEEILNKITNVIDEKGQITTFRDLAEEAADLLKEVRTGEDFECECWDCANKIDELLRE